MRSAGRIALKDLKLRLRDRSAIILGVVAPIALAVILNLVFGDVFDTAAALNLEYGVVDLDKSEISAAFVEVLEDLQAEDILVVEQFDSQEDAEAAVDEGELDSYFLLNRGIGAAVFAGQGATIHVVGDVDAPTSTQIAKSIADRFVSGVEVTRLAVLTTAEVGDLQLSPDSVTSLQAEARDAAFSYELSDRSAATRQLDPTTYFAAGMGVFFLFFTVQFGVSGLLEEERNGTLDRLMAAPIRRESVIGAKAMLSFILGVLSMGILIVSTSWLIGANWGDPLGVALLVVAGVMSATGIIGLVGSVAKTPEGAGNLGSIIAVILGMLGGAFFQVGQGDDLLSRLSFVTPHAWFLRGLGDLAGGASWEVVLPAVGAMLGFAVVTGSVGWVLLKRRLAA